MQTFNVKERKYIKETIAPDNIPTKNLKGVGEKQFARLTIPSIPINIKNKIK